MEVFEAVLVKGEAVLAGDSNELFLEFVVMLEEGGVAEAAVPVLVSVASEEERDLGEDFLLLLPLLPLLPLPPLPLLLLPKLFSLLPTDPLLTLPPNLFNLNCLNLDYDFAFVILAIYHLIWRLPRHRYLVRVKRTSKRANEQVSKSTRASNRDVKN
jgi:hypothetical protein